MPDSTSAKRVTTALFYGLLALLAWLTFLVFQPFLTPLIWASVLVILFFPWHRRLERRLGRTLSATLSTIVVTAILIVPALMVLIAFVHQAIALLESLELGTFLSQSVWLNRVWMWMAHRLPSNEAVDLPTVVRVGAQRVTAFLAGQLGGIVRNVLVFLFDLVLTVITMFYFFRDAAPIMRWLRRSLPFPEEQREAMIAQAHDLVFLTVASSLAAAGLTGLVGALAFWLVGIHQIVLWGVVMALFALLPVLGAWMVWLPAAGWLVAEGQPVRAIILLALCGGALLIIDNVIRPLLISERSELNGLWVLVGVLGGVAVFGMIGLVLGPVIVAFAASFLKSYTLPMPAPVSPQGPNPADP
ncbi:MAG TPA: AI-2E family transporter [Candidatus Dormibacteraeota bacterium]|nr:AI-2E family transporter [Candidatus Dormibacteraeota bacterium]